MVSFIPLFDMINVAVPESDVADPKIFIWILVSTTYAAGPNPLGEWREYILYQ